MHMHMRERLWRLLWNAVVFKHILDIFATRISYLRASCEVWSHRRMRRMHH